MKAQRKEVRGGERRGFPDRLTIEGKRDSETSPTLAVAVVESLTQKAAAYEGRGNLQAETSSISPRLLPGTPVAMSASNCPIRQENLNP